ncbi:hypothetical protein [Corallococcus terminator]|uniref:Uncharacterized protein n=1 Tax=Corallococcus terminator TaxID=2316733 RepID=A0A3A8JAG0_9BACT|nr:hypothetical protein [Corallococcus terminator]RKG92669.1 hypothetical protein D7V88_05245 [Corallococcus terminator]
MKTINAQGRWGRVLAVVALLWGVTAAAQAAPTPVTVLVTTDVLVGSANDTVVASVVDAGVLRTGPAVPVTLRILSDRGVVLATVTGTVGPGSPLRLTARAPSSAGVRAQLVLLPSRLQMSAGVLVLEREDPSDPPPKRAVCLAPAKDPTTTMPEPVTVEGCWVEVEE